MSMPRLRQKKSLADSCLCLASMSQNEPSSIILVDEPSATESFQVLRLAHLGDIMHGKFIRTRMGILPDK